MSEPPPLLTGLYVRNMPLADTKLSGDFRLRHLASKRSDQHDITFCYFRKNAALATAMRAMKNPIFVVGASCFPGDVFSIYTRAIPARMRRLMSGGWSWAVGSFAYKLVDVEPMAKPYRSISSANLVEGPYKTIVTVKCQDHIVVKILNFAVSRLFACERITVPSPSRIVRHAPPVAISTLAAFWNRAYREISHSDLRERLAWLEPVAALQRSAGSLFVSCSMARSKV